MIEHQTLNHTKWECKYHVVFRVHNSFRTLEQFAFGKGETTFGQRCRTITREVFLSLLSFNVSSLVGIRGHKSQKP